MPSKVLTAALWYSKNGYSIIPVKRDKKPFISWERFIDERADEDIINEWWGRWPEAQLAIVCGRISGITVVDADSEDSYRNLQDNFISDTLMIPTVRTSKGYHFYFRHCPQLTNSTRFFEACDIKNDRGYVLAPPSKNNLGDYAWLKGLSLTDITPPEFPPFLLDSIAQCNHIPVYKNDSIPYAVTSEREPPPDLVMPRTKIDLTEGSRDESIFHVALTLAKGGASEQEIHKVLVVLANQCTPPFPISEIPAKIKSAFQFKERRKINFKTEVERYLSITNGSVSVSDVYQGITSITERNERNKSNDLSAVRTTLWRMWKDGKIERVGARDGIYRAIETDCEEEDWLNTECNPVKIYLPLELDKVALISPGDIVLVAGAQNAGKTAFLLNVAKENMSWYNVHYFSSEMSASKFKRRMSRFDNCDLTDIARRVKFYKRQSQFENVIKTGEGNLNIIDYLEKHDNFYGVSEDLAKIFEKLDGAIAIVAIQKDPKNELGRGGSFTNEKPVLSISINYGVAKITKCKEFPDGIENPQGKSYNFKLVQGCRFMRAYRDTGWHREEIKHGI